MCEALYCQDELHEDICVSICKDCVWITATFLNVLKYECILAAKHNGYREILLKNKGSGYNGHK